MRVLALYHLHGAWAEETGEDHLVEIGRQGQNGREHGDGVGPDRYGHVHTFEAVMPHPAVVLRALLVGLPVHARRTLVEDLHAIHAAVPLARVGVAGKDERQGDESSAILGPALQRRQIPQRKALRPDHLLASSLGYRARKERPHLRQFWRHLELADERSEE